MMIEPANNPVLVSACLIGVNCRYDGTANQSEAVLKYLGQNNYQPVPVCPEQLAGLSTPRPKAWFETGDGRSLLKGEARMVDETGQDCTAIFLRGAEETLKIAEFSNCRLAILKQRSPSCGSRSVYRRGKLIEGAGITCALLEKSGIRVTCEEMVDSLE